MKINYRNIDVEFKPCPFCGKDTAIRVTDDKMFKSMLKDRLDAGDKPHVAFKVECVDCSVHQFVYNWHYGDTAITRYGKLLQKSAEQWNKRSSEVML